MPRLSWTGDQIANRITLVLPEKYAKDESSSVWKFFRGLAEIFKINVDGIDELFMQTNLTSASGEFVDDYITDLSQISRSLDETDDDYKARFYKNVFVYNGTKNGVRQITYDVLGYNPLALVSKERGGNFDALHYFNDIYGGSHYGDPNGEAFTGYIHLKSRPSSGQLDELCTLLIKHKAMGVKIYLKFKRYDDLTGYSYEEIVTFVTEQTSVKIAGLAPYGDFYDARGYYNDTNYKTIYGAEDESELDHKYIYLAQKPEAGQLEELLDALSDNIIPGDKLYVVYPEEV